MELEWNHLVMYQTFKITIYQSIEGALKMSVTLMRTSIPLKVKVVMGVCNYVIFLANIF